MESDEEGSLKETELCSPGTSYLGMSAFIVVGAYSCWGGRVSPPPLLSSCGWTD